jgi:ubiquinone/menaquinone biosynthesis C-methylase UbiE
MRWLGWLRRSPAGAGPAEQAERWQWISGRTVPEAERYIFPKQVSESDRLDLQHYLLRLAFGGNSRAPLRQPRKVLDVACGTGLWLRELAREFPQAHLIGLDKDLGYALAAKSRLEQRGQALPQVHFLQADVLQPLPLEDEQFDFTHARLLGGFLPIARWPALVRELARVTRPGGYIELVENELPQCPSLAVQAMLKLSLPLLERYGLHTGVGPFLEQYLRQAGLVRVQQRRVVLGTGQEARRQQQLICADLIAGTESFQTTALKTGLATQVQYQTMLEDYRRELPSAGVTWAYTCAYGMKPL